MFATLDLLIGLQLLGQMDGGEIVLQGKTRLVCSWIVPGNVFSLVVRRRRGPDIHRTRNQAMNKSVD